MFYTLSIKYHPDSADIFYRLSAYLLIKEMRKVFTYWMPQIELRKASGHLYIHAKCKTIKSYKFAKYL